MEKGEDIFVHRTGLVNSYDGLQPDQEVVFETEDGERGMKAVDVELKN